VADPRKDEGAPATPGVVPAGRLPYEKPAVAWEQPLEAQPGLMAACGKTPAEGPDCGGIGPISS